MGNVTVIVLHPPCPAEAGPLTTALDAARRELADRHVTRFLAAGASEARIITDIDGHPFGARLRRLIGTVGTSGIVILGSGALALAVAVDYRAFVAAAAGDTPRVLANNRFSADAVAVAGAAVLRDVPDLPADNALPRWLEEVAGYPVDDLRHRPRLGVDLDSPADLILLGDDPPVEAAASPLPARLAAVRAVLADRRAEVTIAGRTSAGTLAILERRAACRVRALVEERGMRAASRLAMRLPAGAEHRAPASALGLLLDLAGPDALGRFLARLGDAALVDTRVLLAHRLGADDRLWPSAEDRFASDLLLPSRIADPWLRSLTESAVAAPIPVLLGGHTLVGPGLQLVAAGGERRHAP
jgi:hypothetical protein